MKIREIIKSVQTLIAAIVLLTAIFVVTFYFVSTHNYLILCSGYFLIFLLSCYWYYDWPFLIVILIPFIPFYCLWNICFEHKNTKIKNYINQFNLNKPNRAVIVLASFKPFSTDYFLKDNYSLKELKTVIEYINIRKVDFSIYYKASRSDIFKIMADSTVREVYFMGHGTTGTFQLDDENSIYYEDFNDSKYFKDFVHQLHCGTKEGVPLREYVVAQDNWKMCFLKNKSIGAKTITKWFRSRINVIKDSNYENTV